MARRDDGLVEAEGSRGLNPGSCFCLAGHDHKSARMASVYQVNGGRYQNSLCPSSRLPRSYRISLRDHCKPIHPNHRNTLASTRATKTKYVCHHQELSRSGSDQHDLPVTDSHRRMQGGDDTDSSTAQRATTTTLDFAREQRRRHSKHSTIRDHPNIIQRTVERSIDCASVMPHIARSSAIISHHHHVLIPCTAGRIDEPAPENARVQEPTL